MFGKGAVKYRGYAAGEDAGIIGLSGIAAATGVGAALSFFASNGTNTTYRTPNPGFVNVGIGSGNVKQVPQNSLVAKLFGRQGIWGNVYDAMNAVHGANNPLMEFLTGRISQKTLGKMALAEEQRIKAQSHATAHIVSGGKVDATFTLEPTKELSDLLKPQKIRTKVPLKFEPTNYFATPPTTKGRATTRNQ